jgi:peptidoglycan/xylan/chitin deacetylase (PgdA/CDA1 family)
LKKCKLPATIFIVSSLQKGLPEIQNNFEMLNWEQIREMVKQGILIGSHSISHPKLDLISDERLKEEIEGSKEKIEKEIGIKVKYFAYPKGRFNQKTISFLKKAGYEAALSTKRGLIKKGDNIFAIKRNYIDRSLSWLEFKAILTQALNWQVLLAKLYHRFF